MYACVQISIVLLYAVVFQLKCAILLHESYTKEGQIMATISTHNGTTLSQSHNLREGKSAKDGHIDRTRTAQNETIYHERIEDAYKRLFDVSVAEFNKKQRPCRRIENYFQKIKADKKKNVAYELIVGVYPDKGEQISGEVKRTILREFVGTWKDRNPNLELVGAYYHADEKGGEHMHIDYIPVARNCTRGPAIQTALVKALSQQGIEGEKDEFNTAQMKWEARENSVLEGLCRERGIEVRHPQRDAETKTKHLNTPEYKQAQAELQELRTQKKALTDDIQQLKEDFNYWDRQAINKRDEVDERIEQIKKVQDQQDYQEGILQGLKDKVKELKEYVGEWSSRPEVCPADDEIEGVKPFFGAVIISAKMWKGIKTLLEHFRNTTEYKVLERNEDEKKELHELRKFKKENEGYKEKFWNIKDSYSTVYYELQSANQKRAAALTENNRLKSIVSAVREKAPELVRQIEKEQEIERD